MSGENNRRKTNISCRVSTESTFHVDYRISQEWSHDFEAENFTHTDLKSISDSHVLAHWDVEFSEESGEYADISLRTNINGADQEILKHALTAETCFQLADLFQRAGAVLFGNMAQKYEAAKTPYAELMDGITEQPPVSIKEKQDLIHHTLEVESKL